MNLPALAKVHVRSTGVSRSSSQRLPFRDGQCAALVAFEHLRMLEEEHKYACGSWQHPKELVPGYLRAYGS